MFVHPSAEHSYLYFFLPVFLAATLPSSSPGGDKLGRFLLFAATFLPAAFRDEPSPRIAVAAERRVEEVDRCVEADEFRPLLAAAAAVSLFLS